MTHWFTSTDRTIHLGGITHAFSTGHTYITKPVESLFFTALAVPAGRLVLPTDMPPLGNYVTDDNGHTRALPA